MPEPEKTYRAGTLVYTKAGLFLLFGCLLWGDFCYFMSEAVPGIMPLKFKDLHCPEYLIGIVLATIPRAFGAVCNPIISFRSDRFRSRWGRRIPFIFVTMPFLVLSFIGIGYAPDIAGYLHARLPALSGYVHAHPHLLALNLFFKSHGVMTSISKEVMIVIVLSVFLICFDFFNQFVSAVFWYLFNDVVPEELYGRFMSMFRMVIMLTGVLYNQFIFPHSLTHFREVFTGAGLLYLAGFSVMCLMVKEGEYPPPPENDGGRPGIVGSVKTYARECLSLPHYWYFFLMSVAGSLGGACGIFNSIFQRDIMGLTMTDIGHLGVAGALGCAVYVPIAGWLVDKYHPVRINLWGNLIWMCLQPMGLIWLFWHASPRQYFWFMIIQGFLSTWPVAMMMQGAGLPMMMKLLPKERFGQFCSCNAMFGAVTGIISGGLGGLLISSLKHFFSERTAYCLAPIWGIFFTGISTYLMVRLHRSWKEYGGEETYVPPLPEHLRPVPEAAVPVVPGIL